jgi:hypothetical protein
LDFPTRREAFLAVFLVAFLAVFLVAFLVDLAVFLALLAREDFFAERFAADFLTVRFLLAFLAGTDRLRIES